MQESITVKTNSPYAWLLASRPKTLSGAAVPVMIGAALAWADAAGKIAWLPCLLCFLFAFIMQIDANFINDYFDFKKGNDDAATRLGPQRACSMGWVTTGAMAWAIGITTLAGCVVGLPLIIFGGWQMVAVGALCVLFCFLYTTKLSYLGMGDVLVLVFFGIVPVCMTYYLSLPADRQCITLEVFVASLACGAVIDTLLLVNNYRDIDNDRRDGKRTLVVKVGRRNGQLLYLWAGLLPMLLGLIFLIYGHLWAFFIPVAVYPILHVRAYRHLVSIDRGAALNEVLGETARNMFVYGLLTSLGLLLSA
jgi:1,4-dihydroxy-2-naphthoate octaprenyltransferase